MKLDKLTGLQKVFNMSGKNPHNHYITRCLAVLLRMRVLNIIGALLATIGVTTLVISVVQVIIYSHGIKSIAVFIVGASSLCWGISLIRKEWGQNLIDVADRWRRLTSQVKRLDKMGGRLEVGARLDLSGMESGHQVASVFELFLVKIVTRKIQAERDGCPSLIQKLEELFQQTHTLAKELLLDVAGREDFFKGKGSVRFTSYVTLQKP